MSAHSKEERDKRCLETRERAAALLEDLQFFREVIERPEQSPGELRRLSGTLRRILINRDIDIIASPRRGRVTIATPDNRPAYDVINADNCDVVVSLGVPAFGIVLRAFMNANVVMQGFHPDLLTYTRLDRFLAQNVIFHGGRWISRGTVIEYVAYIKHGIHSGRARANDIADMEALNIARRAFRMKINDSGNPALDAKAIAAPDFNPDIFTYDPQAVDCVLLELLAVIHFIVESPAVVELEEFIRKELSAE